uniref:Secreted RxLR effector protein 61 n=1 Tax=Plasmopara viticola TaxID=143451 RepID=RLR61_PLAVT|nr:RecName: Full=Secreted RxLR effector protein 61; Flags: Precursor [Plasmopara viticola]ANC73383.1 secreted RxLR effector peptide protein 61 [Plasmopara viticola]
MAFQLRIVQHLLHITFLRLPLAYPSQIHQRENERMFLLRIHRQDVQHLSHRRLRQLNEHRSLLPKGFPFKLLRPLPQLQRLLSQVCRGSVRIDACCCIPSCH